MAITYTLGSEPFWTIINSVGTVAGGAKMYTRSSLDHDTNKAVYKDSDASVAWPNPIVFDLNGVQGPFYWADDSDDTTDNYYIFVNDADGNLLWSINNFTGNAASGTNTTTTTYVEFQNYISNNVFIDHIDDITTTTSTNLVIAPSNHKGFTPALVNPISASPYGVIGPDIRFVKDSIVNTDAISFVDFPLGTSDLGTADVTPVQYVRYVCTTSITGESYKYFQFPITQKVKNLAATAVTFQVWARVAVTPVTLTAWTMQYFGSGTNASAPVRTQVSTTENFTLTTSWALYSFQFTIDSVADKSLGDEGKQTNDDALYMQLQMPLNTACDVYFIKPSLYLGSISPGANFVDYDQIDSVNQTPRTGDIKTSLLSSVPQGWIAMNDGTIGEVGSGADRANQDTFQLYKTIWDGVDNAYAPVSTGRGASAVADFVAGKTLTLPLSLGRALAGAGAGAGLTSRDLGEYVGDELITEDAMPAHTHGYTIVSGSGSTLLGGATYNVTSGTTGSTGGSAADGNMQPTSFFNIFIKL